MCAIEMCDAGIVTFRVSSRPGYLRIPRGRLCYLPPEIVVLLKPTPRGLNCFWRSRASDVFAFGYGILYTV